MSAERNDVPDDGGPAFPVHPDIRDDEPHAGMRLRDYFAAQMLPKVASGWPAEGLRDEYARHAYEMADAMLRARSTALASKGEG